MRVPTTNYVRERLSRTPWSQRGEIERLLELEDIASGLTRSWGWVYNGYVRPQRIRERHSDYLSILNELRPADVQRSLREYQDELEQARAAHLGQRQAEATRRRGQFEESVRIWRKHGGSLDEKPTYVPLPTEELTLDQEEAYYRARGLSPPWTQFVRSPEHRIT